MDFDRSIIKLPTLTVSYRTFTALKILCASVILPPPPQPLVCFFVFAVSIILSFPACHGNTHVTSSDWLLSFSTMHLSFLHVFSKLDSSFLFMLLNNIPPYRCSSLFMY